MKHEITARRLQQAMHNINISAQELSNASGVAKASISQYVNGSHRPSNISSGKMAKILKVNPLWLMGFDVPMECSTIIPLNELKEQIEDKAFQNFINLISTAGYEIDDCGNNIYEILSERYHWHFKLSKKELQELDKIIMNYVCFTTDKFMQEKYDEILASQSANPNAANERTDINITDEMKEHDDTFFDED